jgi:hypothetical protein
MRCPATGGEADWEEIVPEGMDGGGGEEEQAVGGDDAAHLLQCLQAIEMRQGVQSVQAEEDDVEQLVHYR